MDRNKGFTILELLIVTTIIALFSGFSLASYNSYTKHRQLKADAEQLENTLQLAQRKAAVSDTPAGCADLTGYQVEITSATNYSFQYVCSGTPTNIQTYVLSFGLALSPASATVMFKPITGEANLNSTLSVSVVAEDIEKSIDLSIYPSGLITKTENMGGISPTPTPAPTVTPTLVPTASPSPTSTPTPIPPTPTPICSCGPWFDNWCESGSCVRGEMGQGRNCNPSGCAPANQCVVDPRCR